MEMMSEKKQKNVLWKTGIMIDSQRRGSSEHDYFRGVESDHNTCYVEKQRAEQMHRIQFVNVVTGEKYSAQFKHRMGIGRADNVYGMEMFLTVKGDAFLSRYQCWIYDVDAHLYIENASRKTVLMVNDQVVHRPILLQNGAIIQAGNTKLRVVLNK